MVALPVGEFLMGSPEDEAERYSNEGPRHRVTIGYPSAIGRYPITVVEYRRFFEATGHSHAGGMKSWRDPGFQPTDIPWWA